MIDIILVMLFSVASFEIISRLKLILSIKKLGSLSIKSLQIINSEKISEHWKEKVLRKYSLKLLKESLKSAFVLLILATTIALFSFVSPNFHPTTLTIKDGTIHTGFIEKDGDLVELRMITGIVMKLSGAQISKRATSHQSMMPAGLVQSPVEMNHLLAYMLD